MPGGSLVRGYLPLAEMGLGLVRAGHAGHGRSRDGRRDDDLVAGPKLECHAWGLTPGSGEAEVLQTISEAMGNASRSVIEELNKKK